MATFNEEDIHTAVDRVSIRFGYTELKEEQRCILLNFLKGRDVFGCLPTGFGKSVCFLLLPMLFDELCDRPVGTSIAVVIAPLTGLMKDQVDTCMSRGISAIAVTKENDSKLPCEKIIGQYQIIYVSPEMAIGTRKWREALLDDKYKFRLCAIIIDEAHCVKKWSV